MILTDDGATKGNPKRNWKGNEEFEEEKHNLEACNWDLPNHRHKQSQSLKGVETAIRPQKQDQHKDQRVDHSSLSQPRYRFRTLRLVPYECENEIHCTHQQTNNFDKYPVFCPELTAHRFDTCVEKIFNYKHYWHNEKKSNSKKWLPSAYDNLHDSPPPPPFIKTPPLIKKITYFTFPSPPPFIRIPPHIRDLWAVTPSDKKKHQ